ncbi:hypothetical protein [Endozoicomonas atrinae]|uniref:hypothetical protein n=1 Tax=Endozoicomonas atrinae TaxID=1333660 RepID=UPI003B001A17
MKRWQNNIPEYLISPLTTGFRKISIGVVKDSTTSAFGIIGKVETPVDWMTIFPNLALVESKINGEGKNFKSKG